MRFNPSRPSVSVGIPKRLHQIWLGGKPMPKRWAAFRKRLQGLHPSWEYRLWTDRDLPELFARDTFHVSEHWNRFPNYGFQSDLMRLMILWQYGGVYLDTDCEPLRPLDGLQEASDAFIGATFSPQPMPEVLVENAVIGAAAGHPFLHLVQAGLSPILALRKDSDFRQEILTVVLTTGPGFLSEMLVEYRQKRSSLAADVAVVPSHCFYPVVPGGAPLQEPQGPEQHPGTLLIHHWDGSWIRQRYRDDPPCGDDTPYGYYGYGENQ